MCVQCQERKNIMKKLLIPAVLAATLLIGALVVPVGGQTLAAQVLLLLSRANTWTATQTIGTLVVTDSCTGCGGSGSGTVTSVAMTVAPSGIFDISGTPITISGTLALSLDNQNANIVLAGASSGGAAEPAFRALVDADIPNDITIAGTNIVTWAALNKTGSTLADLATRSAGDLNSGTLALARLTDSGTANLPLVSGGGGGDPVYENLDISVSANITGELNAANFPTLTGDITTAGGALATTLANTAVSAASYGSSTQVGTFTVDSKGRLTAASNTTISTVALLDASRHSDTAADAATRGSIIIGNSSNLWDELLKGTSGQFLRTDGTDVAWGVDGSSLTTLNAGNISSGTLALARGGTNGSITAAAGAVIYSTGSALSITAVGSSGECLESRGTSAPAWDTCATAANHDILSATHGDTLAAGVSRGSIMIGNSTPAWSELTVGANGTFLRSNGTDLSFSTNGSGLTSLNASNLTTGTVAAGRLPTIAANAGGTGLTVYTIGDLLSASATTTLAPIVAVGSGQVLTSAGTGTLPAWSASPTLTNITAAELNLTTELNMGGEMLIVDTAPTISSGFGSSPSIASENGPSAFTIDVGTGGSATGGVIGLPTAATGWNCFVHNQTDWAAGDAARGLTRQTAETTTTVTVENQLTSDGVALAWTASDILIVSCFAY